jgi:4-hydroxyphenylpyruvate dioxygenase-like putative hemolysin
VAIYANFFGVAKPNISITETREKTGANYRGRPTEARAKIANFRFDSILIELIEPDEHPSTWREFLDNNGEGIHHVAFLVNDTHGIIRRLKNKNIDVIQRGKFPGGQYTYIDTLNNLKFMIELLQMNK